MIRSGEHIHHFANRLSIDDIYVESYNYLEWRHITGSLEKSRTSK